MIASSADSMMAASQAAANSGLRDLDQSMVTLLPDCFGAESSLDGAESSLDIDIQSLDEFDFQLRGEVPGG